MERLQQQVAGEVDSQQWWDNLQQWKMPWGGRGRRGYRRGSDPEPTDQANWLVDWNGGLLWSDSTAAGSLPALQRDLEQRLCQAFDPQGLFAGASV
jgi:hypothetical protein